MGGVIALFSSSACSLAVLLVPTFKAYQTASRVAPASSLSGMKDEIIWSMVFKRWALGESI
jgi:hypothetical protein